jgi:hypothetical protein
MDFFEFEHELNRRGMRPTQDGGVEANDPDTGEWVELGLEDLEELAAELELFLGIGTGPDW